MHTLDIKKLIAWGAYALCMLAVFLYYDRFVLSLPFAALCLLVFSGVVLNSQSGKETEPSCKERPGRKVRNFSGKTGDKALGAASEAGAAGRSKGRSPGKGFRDPAFDILRILAVYLVISAHVFQAELGFSGEDSMKLRLMEGITLVCNPLYVMLSGALLLRWKEESIPEFYARRLGRIVLPLVTYYAFYLWENGLFRGLGLWEALGLMFGNLIACHTPETPYYWLIFVIISLYVVFPFLRYMLRDLPYGVLFAMSVLALICMTVVSFTAVLPGAFFFSNFLSGWLGAAILGYFVSQGRSRRFDLIFMLSGIAALFFIAYMIMNGTDLTVRYASAAPELCLLAMALFALTLHCSHKAGGRLRRVLSFISEQSYGMILIHWWVLYWPLKRIFGFGDRSLGIPLCFLCAAASFVISLIAAFGINRLVIYPIEIFFRFVRKSFHKLHTIA